MKLIEWMKLNDVNDNYEDDEIFKTWIELNKFMVENNVFHNG
jgi:hypothetical protein